ncbi:hypothetical protein NXH76_04490 [Blautia schinkii]|nr:hypothetical protein [Blautia schinkii]
MKFIDKLERKFGRFGIPNLTMYIIICYVLGYLLTYLNPSILYMLNLEPALILHGQVWRLVTWVISPPDGGSNPLFFMIAIFFFYYPIGNSLERAWGSFRYTLYVLSGLIFTVIGAFLIYFLTGGRAIGIGSIFSTFYISMSIFLAFATSFPDMQVLLMFVIPIKMKWMAIVYVAIIGYDIIGYLRGGYWYMIIPIVASLLNFILFFFGTRDMHRYNPKEIRRKQEFRKAVSPTRVNPSTGGISKHKCAICGRTELDDPNLEFRFCSKCNGNYEYCQDHLFTHTHVK